MLMCTSKEASGFIRSNPDAVFISASDDYFYAVYADRNGFHYSAGPLALNPYATLPLDKFGSFTHRMATFRRIG